jgi:Na+/proline symporter
MNRPPSITNEQQALRNAGWTLPVASASVVVLMISLGFAFAPTRKTGKADADGAETASA